MKYIYVEAFKKGMAHALAHPERRLGDDLLAAQMVMRQYPPMDANIGTYFGMGITVVMAAIEAFTAQVQDVE